MSTVICLYPKFNPLAVGAKPKPCGKEANIATNTQVFDGKITTRLSKVCLEHSVSIAISKLAQSLEKPFTLEEKLELAKYYPEFIETPGAFKLGGDV